MACHQKLQKIQQQKIQQHIAARAPINSSKSHACSQNPGLTWEGRLLAFLPKKIIELIVPEYVRLQYFHRSNHPKWNVNTLKRVWAFRNPEMCKSDQGLGHSGLGPTKWTSWISTRCPCIRGFVRLEVRLIWSCTFQKTNALPKCKVFKVCKVYFARGGEKGQVPEQFPACDGIPLRILSSRKSWTQCAFRLCSFEVSAHCGKGMCPWEIASLVAFGILFSRATCWTCCLAEQKVHVYCIFCSRKDVGFLGRSDGLPGISPWHSSN